KAAVDEMRDVRPAPAVALGHLDRVAVIRSVGREPRLADGVGRQSAGAAFGEDGLLKPGQHVLAKDGRERVFELAREERDLHFRIALPLDEVVEDEHLAEYRGRLG